jgi:hypothetical protein
MTAQEFVQKWAPSELRERQGSQEHFLDLCRLLDEPTPAEADPCGKKYCFDAGVEKTLVKAGSPTFGRRAVSVGSTKGNTRTLPTPMPSCNAMPILF